MSQSEKVRLGDVLFQGIDENDYLNELYKNILYNYAITTLRITNIKQLRGINVDDALRFADLLSKSTHPEKSDATRFGRMKSSPCSLPYIRKMRSSVITQEQC